MKSKDTLNILMVHPHDLFSPLEPWTIRIIKFAEELVKKGHEVRIAYFPLDGAGANRIGMIEVVPFERRISPVSLIRNTIALCRLVQEADVVHFQKSHFYAALPALLAAYTSGKPAHYDWDDWEEKIFYSSVHKKTLSAFLAGTSFQLMERGLPFLADSVSVSSEALRELAIKRGADKDRVFLAHVGADLNLFSAGGNSQGIREKFGLRDELLVLYHGQLHSCQYVNLFLHAIKIISGTTMADRLKFMVLGDGSQRAMLQKSSQSLGVDDRVIFTGFVPHADVPQYVAAADICVAPFEDNEVTRCKSPLKIAEYLASGKAIIASDVGEVRNMVQGVGMLVSPGDPEGLASGILELAGNDPLRASMAVAARQRAEEKYNWRSSVENLEKAYLLNGI